MSASASSSGAAFAPTPSGHLKRAAPGSDSPLARKAVGKGGATVEMNTLNGVHPAVQEAHELDQDIIRMLELEDESEQERERAAQEQQPPEDDPMVHGFAAAKPEPQLPIRVLSPALGAAPQVLAPPRPASAEEEQPPKVYTITAERMQQLMRQYVSVHLPDFFKKKQLDSFDTASRKAAVRKIVSNHSRGGTREELLSKLVKDQSVKMTDDERMALRNRLTFAGVHKEKVKYEFCGRHFLATWNHAKWETEVPKGQDGQAMTSLGEVTEHARENPFCKKLVDDVHTDIMTIIGDLEPGRWGYSVEVCPDTLAKEAKLRLHVHLVASWAIKKHFRSLGLQLKIQGVQPGDLQATDGTDGKKRTIGPEPMMYYVLMPKRGQVRAAGNYWPHMDFTVSPRMIQTWVTRGKLDWKSAEMEYVYACNNLRFNLANLDLYVSRMRGVLNRDRRTSIGKALAAEKSDFIRVIPAVPFRAQFSKPRDRTYALVLDGYTGTGKTYWARWALGNPDLAMVINCSGIQCEPDHKPFVENQTKIIVYDELQPSLMARYRKIFQAPPYELTLGQSATNDRTYSVFLSGTMQIICANHWEEQLKEMEAHKETQDDAQWVRGNTFHVFVDRPLRIMPTDPLATHRFLYVDWHEHAVRTPGGDVEIPNWHKRLQEEQEQAKSKTSGKGKAAQK